MGLSSILIFVGVRLSALTFGTEIEPDAIPRLAAGIGVEALSSPVAVEADDVAGAELTFYNVNTRVTESFFLRFDGQVEPADEKRLEDLFRCKRSGHKRKVDRGLVAILARLAAKYQGHTFELVSAHRAVPASVRTSKHYSGHAVDFRVRGVKLRDVRTFLWEELTDMPIGLGHYHREGFLHIDHRPGEPSIAWDQLKPNQSYRYHPRWSRTGRNS